jgi:hypothetical protein
VGQVDGMKPSRLIAWVALSAFTACADGSDSRFRGDDEPMCLDDEPNETTTTIELWPPNHKMQTVALADCAEILACDPDATAEILWVSSDEPAESQHGDDDDDCDEDGDDDDDEDDEDGKDEDDEDDDGDDEDGKDDDDGAAATTGDDDGTSTTTGDDGGSTTTGDGESGGDDVQVEDDGGDDGEEDGEDDGDDDDKDDDEDDDDDDGEATASEDIAFVGPDSVELRAERDGGGNGRVYTIGFVVRDADGNESESSCTVTVPHSQGKDGEAIDDGEAYRVEP